MQQVEIHKNSPSETTSTIPSVLYTSALESPTHSNDTHCGCVFDCTQLPSIPIEHQLPGTTVSTSTENVPDTVSKSLGSYLLWNVISSGTALTASLSLYLGGVSLLLARQIERAHCLECWLTKVLPASVLVGIGGYLFSRLDKRSVERSRQLREGEQEQSTERSNPG